MKKTIKNSKEKLKNYNPKLKEECGVFGISNSDDAAALTALGLHALSTEVKKVVEWYHLMEKIHSRKKDFGLVGDNFNKEKVLKKFTWKICNRS